MFKPIVAVGSLIAGAAAASSVIYMQTNPMAFTSGRTAEPTSITVTRRGSPPPVYLDEAAEDEEAISAEPAIAPKLVTPKPAAKLLREPAAAAPQPTKVELAVTPCTGWRDVGVKAIAGSRGSEARRVRDLCP